MTRTQLARGFTLLALVGCGGPPLPHPRPERIADPSALVAAYYRAVGAEDLPGVLALFDDHPVLVEPFSRAGEPATHRGYEAVGRFFAYSFRTRDDQVVVEFVHPDAAGEVTAGWSLHGSDGFGVSGQSRFVVHDGRIARITIETRD